MDTIISKPIRRNILLLLFVFILLCLFTLFSLFDSEIKNRDKYIGSWAKIAPGSFISVSATGYRYRFNKIIGDKRDIKDNDPLSFLY